jgi:hypothetical protein
MLNDPLSKLRAKQQKGIEAAVRDKLKHSNRDPHNGPIIRFALGVMATVVAICGVVGYAIYHFMK